jgi:hypothetical protein
MFTILVFCSGVLVGVVYEKSLRVWKDKAERAVAAAHDALKQ